MLQMLCMASLLTDPKKKKIIIDLGVVVPMTEHHNKCLLY